MTITKKHKKAGAALSTIIVVAIILFAYFTIMSKPIEAKPDDPLTINETFLLKTGETNETVNVSCELFITNDWKEESGKIKAIAYVSEKNSNYAVYKSTVEFGVINAQTTKEFNIPVKFSGSSYKVEILLFENDKMIKKVVLSINTYQNYYLDDEGDFVYNVGRTKAHADKDGQWSIVPEGLEISSVN